MVQEEWHNPSAAREDSQASNISRRDKIKDFSDKDSIQKMLEMKLLWYDVNVLDTQKLSIFNGVPAFLATIVGSTQLSRIFKVQSETAAKVFKHPTGRKGESDYSYRILRRSLSSSGTDYSGWLIFYDCATDYSGFGGSLFAEAEHVVKGLAKMSDLQTGATYPFVYRYFKDYRVPERGECHVHSSNAT